MKVKFLNPKFAITLASFIGSSVAVWVVSYLAQWGIQTTLIIQGAIAYPCTYFIGHYTRVWITKWNKKLDPNYIEEPEI